MMDIPFKTRRTVYEAAAKCQRDRARTEIPVPADERNDIEAAYGAWLEWGQDKNVELRFTDDGATVFDYVES